MKRTGPGRPPLDDDAPSVPVHVQMPARQYDDVHERAKRERISVPEMIRRDVRAANQRLPKNLK